MNSTLTLYVNSKILAERLFKVDSIETYLAGLNKTTINNFQYIKHSLNLVIKVDKSQTGLEMTSINNINYCKIQNGSGQDAGRVVYYHIIDKKWLSENTIQFYLSMDTINSFVDIVDGITLSDKTKILRQHLDRYEILDLNGSVSDLDALSPYVITEYEEQSDPTSDIFGFMLNGDVIASSSECFIYNPFFEHYELFWADMVQAGANKFRIILTTSNNAKVKLAFIDGEGHTTFISESFILSTSDVNYVEVSYDVYMNCTLKFKTLTKAITQDERLVIVCDSGEISNVICDVYGSTNISLTISQVAWYKEMGEYYATFNIDSLSVRNKIDQYTEGFTPVLYGKFLQYLRDTADMSFYLIYKNQNDPSDSLVNPVDCFIAGDKEIVICQETGGYLVSDDWSYSFIDNLCTTLNDGGGKASLCIHGYVQPNFSLYYYDEDNHEKEIILDENKMLMISTNAMASGVISLVVNEKSSDGSYHTIQTARTYPNSALRIFDFLNMKYITTQIDPRWNTDTFMGMLTLPNVEYSLYADNSYVDVISPISRVDRTSAKIIKIIKLPYSPIEFIPNSRISNTYRMNTNQWELTYDDVIKNTAKLKDFNILFERNINFSLITPNNNPFKPLQEKYLSVNTITGNIAKSSKYETKLYHSDYYLPKCIYDSFSFGFNLELITDAVSIDSTYFKVKYNCTTTINSRFMFTYTDYRCDGKDLEDYNNVMPIARNNDVPIFNQQYINYIRAGYNYDVKNKTRQEVVAFGGATLSLIGAIASFAGSVASGGATIPMGVGLAVSAVGQYTSAISTTIQLEQSFALKQEQLKQQATSVYGSDDVDLMTAYSENRLKLKLYEVSPRMKKALFDLFYYTGYISNVVGLPNTNSRTRFNFVSADIVIKQTPNLPKEIVDDVISKFKLGITYIHYYKNTYDFEQQYENWETSLVNKF